MKSLKVRQATRMRTSVVAMEAEEVAEEATTSETIITSSETGTRIKTAVSRSRLMEKVTVKEDIGVVGTAAAEVAEVATIRTITNGTTTIISGRTTVVTDKLARIKKAVNISIAVVAAGTTVAITEGAMKGLTSVVAIVAAKEVSIEATEAVTTIGTLGTVKANTRREETTTSK
jgi:hypothetical protein